MAGKSDTDLRLSEEWDLTAAGNGDVPTCSDLECFAQDIRLEAVTQPGELFYDQEWGWGLAEFLQAEDEPLLRLEITQRIRRKLARRPEIDQASIAIAISFQADILSIRISFRFLDEEETQSLDIEVNRVRMEVMLID